MSRELWATYSVTDYRRPRELAVDVMLFDRLVFPVPEEGSFSGSPIDIGPVDWKPNDDEWKRWETNGWDPTVQSKLLKILSPVIRKVSWSSEGKMGDEYRVVAARLAAQNVPDWPFAATRTLLTRDLPAYVDSVTLGPVYRTFEEFERERGKQTSRAPKMPGQMVLSVLAAEFIVPDIEDERFSSPEELLKETVDFVTGDTTFRDKRTAFIEWQHDFISNKQTDKESIHRAIEKMRDLLEDANKAAKKLTVRNVARNLFRVGPAMLGFAGALAGGGPAFAAGGMFLSFGAVAIDEKFFKSAEDQLSPTAALTVAFVHDAHRHFGWSGPRSA